MAILDIKLLKKRLCVKMRIFKNEESEKKNFTFLDQLIHNGQKEIKLENDIILEEKEEEKYPEGILLNVKDMVIDGNGHSIDAQGRTRIFKNTEKNITIKNITLQNGNAEYFGGGAIYNNDGTINLENTILQKNNAENGGAIYNSDGTLNLQNTTLKENTAMEEATIYNKYDGKITMNNCTLTKNFPSSQLVENNEKYNILLNDKFISSNNAKIYLNGIYEGRYNISENMIHWNKKLSDGKHEITLELDNNKIIMNFTYSSETITDNVNSYTELIKSINKAKYIITPKYIINLKKGDYNATKSITLYSILNSMNCIINGNETTLNGQNKYQFIKTGRNCQLTLNNIILTNYIAEYGAAIENNGTAIVTNTTIKNNHTTQNGGAIENYGEITIQNSTITDNHSKYCGGAIHNEKDGKITIQDTTLSENTTEKGDGGAIHNHGTATLKITTLTDNHVKRDGGAIHNYGEITVQDSQIIKNTVTGYPGDGGAIYNTGRLKITDTTIKNNHATQDGGAISNEKDGTITIQSTTFTQNKSNLYGETIHNDGEITIENSIIDDNTAKRKLGYGGTIINNGTLDLTQTIIKNY